MKVFVDTNLLLDVLAEREPFYKHSARVWSMAETGAWKCMISVISLNNIFYIVRKTRDTATARQVLVLLRDVFTGVALSPRILNQAIDSDMADFEDAIQFYSAIHVGAEYLLTRNVSDFPQDSLPVLTPEEFFAVLEWD